MFSFIYSCRKRPTKVVSSRPFGPTDSLGDPPNNFDDRGEVVVGGGEGIEAGTSRLSQISRPQYFRKDLFFCGLDPDLPTHPQQVYLVGTPPSCRVVSPDTLGAAPGTLGHHLRLLVFVKACRSFAHPHRPSPPSPSATVITGISPHEGSGGRNTGCTRV